VNVATGNYLNPLWPGADTTGTGITNARPDLIREIEYPRTLGQWYDRAAFARPPQGRFGNAARNSVRGPGYLIANLGLSKGFRFERLGQVQVGATFQNVLNHTNFGEPNMQVNNVNGGVITSTHIFPAAGSPRTGQLFFRWNF
jgi:hypothetical protein